MVKENQKKSSFNGRRGPCHKILMIKYHFCNMRKLSFKEIKNTLGIFNLLQKDEGEFCRVSPPF